MRNTNNHIISGLGWNTSFDRKEIASELQGRLSTWTTMHLQKEIDILFNRLCPSEQTWRIKELEVDLGVIQYKDLETELSEKFIEKLEEKLIDILVYTHKEGVDSVEILNESQSPLSLLEHFLLDGLMPWNYSGDNGSLNQMMEFQLQNYRRETIAMIWSIGATNENIRKRIAWQFNETIVVTIIEGLEPNNHEQLIEFSNELVIIQEKENIIRSSVPELKRNIWLWILNYLFTERGTVYNKVAFVTYSIKQMANHYNLDYIELLKLIEHSVNKINRKFNIKPEFIQTLILVTNENGLVTTNPDLINKPVIDYWGVLENTIKDSSLRKTNSQKTKFNDLIINLTRENSSRLINLISALGNSRKLWLGLMNDLRETTLETLFFMLKSAKHVNITESIHFMQVMGQETGLNLGRKRLWMLGIQFVQKHKDSTFSSKEFMRYCLAELSLAGITFDTGICRKLTLYNLPAEIKSAFSPSSYYRLQSIFLSELPDNNKLAYPQSYINEILLKLSYSTIQRSIDAGEFISLQETFTKIVETSPKEVLKSLTSSSDKEVLSKLIPHIINEKNINLLIRHAGNKLYKTILGIQGALSDLKSDKMLTYVQPISYSDLSALALQAYILHPNSGFQDLMLYVLKKLSGQMNTMEWIGFRNTINKFITHPEIRRLGISTSLVDELSEYYESLNKNSILERVVIIMENSPREQKEVGKLLTAFFSDRQFAQLRKRMGDESKKILNYMLPNGVEIVEELIKEQKVQLHRLLNRGEHEIEFRMRELYWKCILDYMGYAGSPDQLKRNFHTSMLYHSLVSRSEPETDILFSGSNEKNYRLTNGKTISVKKIFSLIQKCLKDGLAEVKGENGAIKTGELIEAGLELNPEQVRRIIIEMPLGSTQIDLLKRSISFRQFCLLIVSGRPGKVNEWINGMRFLYDLAITVSNNRITGNVIEQYWMDLCKLIKSGTWSVNDLKKSIQDSIIELVKENDFDTGQLLYDLRYNSTKLNAEIKNSFLECVPVLSKLESYKPEPLSNILINSERKGVLDEFINYVVTKKQAPPWAGNYGEKDLAELLNHIVLYYPVGLQRVLKHRDISEQQISWLSKLIGFKELIHSLKYLFENRQSSISSLEELYNSFGKFTIKGISSYEMQRIIVKKLLIVWTDNNWKIVSSENIWRELMWEVYLKHGIKEENFLNNIDKAKSLLPASMRVSYENTLLGGQTVSAVKKQIVSKHPKKANALKADKGGIFVRNAGIVLLNSYIGILFERLGFTSTNKFKSEIIQADAVHYLQYVITGLTSTEELLLPLNKVLCGLSLDYPVKEGIVISSEHKNIIEGLIKAAIGYWPAIGKCSIQGFRGNWLVRDGLLFEREDKWVLTVEKKAYDILLHKSPYSMSIIKYQWMKKPLHITWPY